MTSQNPYAGYPCPVCRVRSIETVVSVPSIRGYVLGYQMRKKRLPSCARCGRSEMLKEAGRSLFLGWFSPSALIANPFLILWNLGRAPFVGRNYKAVAKLFEEAGIPDPGQGADILRVLYGLAAAMITADGVIEPDEVDTALAAGSKISEGFDPRAFHETVERHAALPSVEAYAQVLSNALDEEQKRLVAYYLTVIALADGDFALSEERLLRRVAKAIEVDAGWVEELIAETKAKAGGDPAAAIEVAVAPATPA